MKSFRIGVVGTSGIAHEFCQALRYLQAKPSLIYSRTTERGKKFSEHYGANATTEFSDLFGCDWVYIASPNAIHFEQAQKLLAAGVHCLIEKPVVLKTQQLRALKAIALKKSVFFLEAFRHLHNPELTKIKLLVKEKQVKEAYFQYCKRSSRLLPNGKITENASVFSPILGGGALNDLGVYCLSLAIELFGKELDYKIQVNSYINDVDADTIVVLRYSGFSVETRCAKTFDHHNKNEIHFADDTILKMGDDGYTFSNCFYQNKPFTKVLEDPTDFIYEIRDFQAMLFNNDNSYFNKYYGLSAKVVSILDSRK